MTLTRGLANLLPREAHKSGRRTGGPAPACLSCGRTMQHTRTIPRLRRLPELRCYECRSCRFGVTEEYAA
jgi:hypothetical protein